MCDALSGLSDFGRCSPGPPLSALAPAQAVTFRAFGPATSRAVSAITGVLGLGICEVGLKAHHVIARAEGPGTRARKSPPPCKGGTRLHGTRTRKNAPVFVEALFVINAVPP
jgi:hypothetical protein